MKHILVVVAFVAAPASAEVVAAGPNGFQIPHRVPLALPADTAYAAFADVGRWWEDDHTYSGSAGNMSLSLSPGACFCERLPSGGGIGDMRVTFANPAEHRVVLTGSLGPLLYEATAGVMDVQVKSAGAASELTLDYRAAGFANGIGDKMAPLVDQVLGAQMKRLRAYAVTRPKG